MSTSPNERALGHRHREVGAAEIEAIAEALLGLIEESEASLCKGRVPPAFAQRIGQLLQTAEHLTAT